MHLLFGLGLSFFFASAVLASEDDALAALSAVAAKAAVHAQTRYAFTVDHWSEQNGEEIKLRLRFDPRLPNGEQWRLLDADIDALDKKARKAFEKLKEANVGDGALVYDKLSELLESAVLSEETQEEAVFIASVADADPPPDAIDIFITLDKANGYVSKIDMRSKEGFKPSPIVKIKSLRQTRQYAAPQEEEGPALLQVSESAAEGKAMFRKFTARSRQTFSDIEAVDVAVSR